MAPSPGPGQTSRVNSAASIAKRALRRLLLDRLEGIAPAERAAASAQLRAQILNFEGWNRSRLVMLFAPMPKEVDVALLWPDAAAAGKSLCFPRFLPSTGFYEACLVQDPGLQLRPGAFGIREPSPECPGISLNRLDLVLVPGVGFTRDGHRLGRGRGYYDRLLADVLGLKCGVGFDQQLVDTIPCEPHDVNLHWVLTPTHRFRADLSRC
jgi:5-formyltetrahydrofolate cyclo-ligase